MILLFEQFKSNLEFENDVKEHLKQFPHLKYSINSNDGIVLTFSSDVTEKYITKILSPFKIQTLEKKPVKIKVLGKKDLDKKVDGKIMVGTIEKVKFPQLGIEVSTKLDSGSTASSLHCSEIKIDTKNKKVTFIPLDKTYKEYTGKKFTTPLVETVKVQSSNGDIENRVMIKLTIEIKGKSVNTYFSLTNRKKMDYPALIGSDALAGSFVIDTSIVNGDEKDNKISESTIFENKLETFTPENFLTKEYIKNLMMSDSAKQLIEDYIYDNGIDTNDDDFDYDTIDETDDFIEWRDEYLRNKFETVKNTIESCFKGDEIEIYREMTVSPNWFKKLKNGDELGIYYSYSKEKADAHWGQFGKGHDTVLITTTVKSEQIDWNRTFNANMDISIGDLEDEITLIKNTPIKIKRLEINNVDVDISRLKDKNFRA